MRRIPLRLAWLCVECDDILCGTRAPQCERCGSRTLIPLTRWVPTLKTDRIAFERAVLTTGDDHAPQAT